MPDDPKPEGATPESTPEPTPTPEDVAAQAEHPDAVKRAVQAEREAAKAAKREADELRAKVREYEERDLSEADKLTKRATDAETAAAEATARLARVEVALEKGLDAELVDRLRGSTKDELAADADALLALFRPAPVEGATPPAGSFDGGARKPADGKLARAEAIALAKSNPREFNRMLDAGKISLADITV